MSVRSRRSNTIFTRFVPAAFRVPGVEPSPSTEKLWSKLSATDAFDRAARGAPMSGRPSRPSSTAEGHGATVTQFFTRRPMTSIFWTTSRPASPDVSNGTQSGGGGGALFVNRRSQSPSITMRSRGNDGFSSSVAAFSSAATASSMRFAPSGGALKRSLGTTSASTCKRLVRADALGRAVVAESAVAAPLLRSAMMRRMTAICELCAMCCDYTT